MGSDMHGEDHAQEQVDNPPDSTGPDAGDVAGKIWNAPNTVLGLGYGAAGYVAGWPSYFLGLQDKPPGITTGNNAIQFTNNPFIEKGAAVTLGNSEIFNNEPTDRASPTSPPVGEHEEQHTYQGEELGPLSPIEYSGGHGGNAD